MEIRYISLYDLLSFDESKEIVKNNDFSGFYKLLHDVGFDINSEIEFQDVYCRSMIDHRIICLGRWVGFERSDREWLESEYCTLNNRIMIAGRKDLHLMLEMERMMRTANFTGMIIDHMGGEDSVYVGTDDALDDMLEISKKVLNDVKLQEKATQTKK